MQRQTLMMLALSLCISLQGTANATTHTATTLTIANKADFFSLDPHTVAESLQLDVLSNVYDSLLSLDENNQLAPGLAEQWEQRSPTVWRFHLRKNARFHHGQLFTARDVLFNFQRAKREKSGVKVFVSTIAEVHIVDEHTVDLQLIAAQPNFLRTLGGWYMLSESWCAEQRCNEENGKAFTAATANGTGPYRVLSREPHVLSTFLRNDHYWGSRPQFDKVVLHTQNDDQKRLSWLKSGTADIVNPLPLSDAEALRAEPAIHVIERPESRILFLGMDLARKELLYSSIKGKNPLQDRRVRQAMYLAIDMEFIHTNTMKGFSRNTNALIPSNVFGYSKELDKRQPYDPAMAKRLMAEAGYADGFNIKLNCPNDRYINDEQLCRAVATELARINIRVELDIETKSAFFDKVLKGDTSFYLLGAATNTGDGFNILLPVLGSPSDGERGAINIGGFHHARLDELLSLAEGEFNEQIRQALYNQITRIGQSEQAVIPLHQQYAVLATRAGLTVAFTPENGMPWRLIKRQND